MFVVVSHAEELNYLFVINGINQTSSEDSADMQTWRRMVRLWTNFIKYGFVEQSNFNYDYEPIFVFFPISSNLQLCYFGFYFLSDVEEILSSWFRRIHLYGPHEFPS